MDARQETLARHCLQASETNTMTFPQIVGALVEGGFESYAIDFRRSVAVYYLPNGESVELRTHVLDGDVSMAFDADALQRAIREAQNLVPGYSYRGFCLKAKAAGCAGYIVSFLGHRAVYFGRDGVIHTEYFPDN